MMRQSIKKGFGFGITSGIITTLGLIIGLYSSIGSKLVIIGGIVTIAIADAASDALGIHISEETRKSISHKEIWESTIATFVFKFVFAIIFILPFLFFGLSGSVIVCLVVGFLLLTTFSYWLGRRNGDSPWGVVFEHLIIAILVLVVVYFVGEGVSHLGLV